MPTSTEEIDIAKLLINGRQGRAFRDFDRDMKEWLKAQYMHMSKYFYTGTRKKVAQRQKNRRKRCRHRRPRRTRTRVQCERELS